jgi:dUTP pyrophosphatase
VEPIELAIVIAANAAATIMLPEYHTEGAAGFDLQANIQRSVMVPPQDWMLVLTGLTMAIPQGYEGQIRARSGLAFKHGISVLNAPGTIDSDYRGEVGVILMNNSNVPFQIKPGDRIAQMVIAAVTRLPIRQADHASHLPETVRGAGGYGSTGQ